MSAHEHLHCQKGGLQLGHHQFPANPSGFDYKLGVLTCTHSPTHLSISPLPPHTPCRALATVFAKPEAEASGVSISCFEVLGDEVHDLLGMGSSSPGSGGGGAPPEGSVRHQMLLQERQMKRQRGVRRKSLLLMGGASAWSLAPPGFEAEGLAFASAASMRQSLAASSSEGGRHLAWTAPPPQSSAAAGSFAAAPAVDLPSRPLQVQTLALLPVVSADHAEAMLAVALAGRTSTSTAAGRAACHLSHAVIRISWSAPPPKGPLATRSRSGGGGAIPMLRVASPSSRRRTLTLLDCCSASAAMLLPPRAAAAAKLGLMSLGHALGRAHLGEAAMGLRETQLTR